MNLLYTTKSTKTDRCFFNLINHVDICLGMKLLYSFNKFEFLLLNNHIACA